MSKYAIKKTEEYVLSEESAIEQICLLLSYYDVDIEAISETDEAIGAAMERGMNQLTKAVRRGKLEITTDEVGKIKVVQTLVNGETLVYAEVNARAKVAAEKFSDANYSRIYAMMGSLAGVGKTAIEKLSTKDLGTVEVLSLVFTNA